MLSGELTAMGTAGNDLKIAMVDVGGAAAFPFWTETPNTSPTRSNTRTKGITSRSI